MSNPKSIKLVSRFFFHHVTRALLCYRHSKNNRKIEKSLTIGNCTKHFSFNKWKFQLIFFITTFPYYVLCFIVCIQQARNFHVFPKFKFIYIPFQKLSIFGPQVTSKMSIEPCITNFKQSDNASYIRIVLEAVLKQL